MDISSAKVLPEFHSNPVGVIQGLIGAIGIWKQTYFGKG